MSVPSLFCKSIHTTNSNFWSKQICVNPSLPILWYRKYAFLKLWSLWKLQWNSLNIFKENFLDLWLKMVKNTLTHHDSMRPDSEVIGWVSLLNKRSSQAKTYLVMCHSLINAYFFPNYIIRTKFLTIVLFQRSVANATMYLYNNNHKVTEAFGEGCLKAGVWYLVG